MSQASLFREVKRSHGVWGRWFSRWLDACQRRGIDVRVVNDPSAKRVYVYVTAEWSRYEACGESDTAERAFRQVQGFARELLQEADDGAERKVSA